MKEKLSRTFLWILGAGLLAAIPFLGRLHFDGNRIRYGSTMNIFGENEGGFFLLFTVLGIAAILSFSLAGGDLMLRVWERVKRKMAGVQTRRIVLLLAVTVFAATLLLRLFVVQQAPMTDDENAYLFGARIMLKGQLFLEGYPPELRPFLSNQFVVMGDKVYTQYCPGFILLLALALKIGAVSLLNPLMAALGVWGTYLLVTAISDSRWLGLGAAVLLCLSPTYMFTNACLFANPSALVCGVYGLYFLFQGSRRASGWQVALGTAFLGYMFLIRPLTTVIMGVVGVYFILTARLNRRKKMRMLGLAAGIGIIFIGLLLLYFFLLTGDPLTTTYAAYDQSVGKTQAALGIGNILSGNFLNLLAIPLLRFNFWLLGWPLSVLLLFALPRGNIRRFLFPVILGIWMVHLLWKVVGVNITGAVHYFEAVPMLIAGVAAAISGLMKRSEHSITAGTVNFIFFSVLISLLVFFPWVSGNISRLARENLRPYRLEQQVERPAVILSKPFRDYRRDVSWTFYRRNNDVKLENDTLWLNRVDEGDYSVLKEYFPHRHFYILRFNRKSPLSREGKYWLEEIDPDPGR